MTTKLVERVRDLAECESRVTALEDSLSAMLGIVKATFPSMQSPSMRASVETASKLVEKEKK